MEEQTTVAAAIEAHNEATPVSQPIPAKPRKWSTQAGPRQSKQVVDAITKVSWESKTYTEISGITGVSEDTSSFTLIYGGGREDCAKFLTDLGEKFGWVVTRDNYQEIIKAIDIGLVELRKSRPVTDKRVTPEQDKARMDACTKAAEEREAKAQQWAKVVDAKKREIAGLFPWVQPMNRGESNHAWVGRNIRAELAQAYPGLVVRVTTDYNNVRVWWDLGPTSAEMKERLEKYEEWRYSEQEMTDEETERKAKHAAVTSVVGGVRYVSQSRNIPPELYTKIGQMICALAGVPYRDLQQDSPVQGTRDRLCDEVYRLAESTAWPAGGNLVAVERAPEGSNAFWVLKIDKPSVPPMAASPAVGRNGNTVAYNAAHEGVEISYAQKPSEDHRAQMKRHGFRCTHRPPFKWYKKFGVESWRLAHELAGIPLAETPGTSQPDRFDMAVEDNMARQCGV